MSPADATATFPRWTKLVLATVVGSAAAWASEPFDQQRISELQAFLENEFTNGNGGMVVGLIDAGGTRILAAGKVHADTDRKVDENTIFEIGSITKTFTSLLLLEMERRGELAADDPAKKYLPDHRGFPSFDGREITLRHLAAQDSGLPFNPDNFAHEELKPAYEAYVEKDLYDFLARHELAAAPGEGFQYSNTGFTVLGLALEKKSGISFEELAVERICRPLGMKDTLVTLRPGDEVRRAPGHDADGERITNLELQIMAPAGALRSTALDLLEYVAANLGLRETELYPLMQKMHEIRHRGAPGFGDTAMPWVDEGVYYPPGSVLRGHSGGTFGSRSFAGFDTGKKRGVVVLSNRATIRSASVGWKLLQGMPVRIESLDLPVREVTGIGAGLTLDEDSGLLEITRVYPRGPAGKAGLEPGQRIVSIDGVAVAGKKMKECLAMLGGKEGARVRIALLQSGSDTARSVELTRKKFLTVLD